MLGLRLNVADQGDKMDDLMTPSEAASYLRMSRRTVQLWCRDGTIPCARVGRSWRIRRADLDAWIEAHRVGVLPVETAS